MSSAMVGRLMAFKGDDDVCDQDVLIDVADHRPGGFVEITVDLGMRNVDRVYLKFSLPELVRLAMRIPGSTP